MRKLLSTIAIVFVCIFVLGITLIVQGKKDTEIFNSEAIDIFDLNYTNCQRDVHINGEILACVGPYAEEYQTRYFIKSSDSTYYYLVFTDEGFISLSTSNKNLVTQLNALSTATYNYLAGETDDIYYPTIEFEGKIIGLDSEIRGYMVEYLDDDTITSEDITKDFLGNYNLVALSDANAASRNIISGYVMMAVGLAGICVVILIFFKTRKNTAQTIPQNYSTPSYVPTQDTEYTQPDARSTQYANELHSNQQMQSEPTESKEPPVMPSLSFNYSDNNTDDNSEI